MWLASNFINQIEKWLLSFFPWIVGVDDSKIALPSFFDLLQQEQWHTWCVVLAVVELTYSKPWLKSLFFTDLYRENRPTTHGSCSSCFSSSSQTIWTISKWLWSALRSRPSTSGYHSSDVPIAEKWRKAQKSAVLIGFHDTISSHTFQIQRLR